MLNITQKEILHIKQRDVTLSWPIFSKVLILEDSTVTLSVKQERVRVIVLYRCKVTGNIRKTFPNLLVLDIKESEINSIPP